MNLLRETILPKSIGSSNGNKAGYATESKGNHILGPLPRESVLDNDWVFHLREIISHFGFKCDLALLNQLEGSQLESQHQIRF